MSKAQQPVFVLVAQLVEHRPFKAVVGGSSPPRYTIGNIAQLVERQPEELGVGGSSPSVSTNADGVVA